MTNLIFLSVVLLLICANELTTANMMKRAKRAAFYTSTNKWVNGVIPYIIDVQSFSQQDLELLRMAFSVYSEETCIKFRPKLSSDENYIRIRDGSLCYSIVGMANVGEQDVILGQACRFLGLYLHELAHSIGLEHEHIRPDRDSHVSLNMAGIPEGERTFYEKLSDREMETYNSPYDLQSIMHYGGSVFHDYLQTRNSTMQHVLKDVFLKDLSFLDVKLINHHYQCHKNCPANRNCLNGGGFVNKNCQCETPESFERRRCRNLLGDQRCSQLTQNNGCYSNIAYVTAYCRKDCGLCYHADISQIVENAKCTNKYDEQKCQNWARRGECESNPSWMKFFCEKSCNACPSNRVDSSSEETRPPTPSTTTAATTTVAACINRYPDSQCDSWAQYDHCNINPSFMNVYCTKSCGRCQNCRDSYNSRSCSDWARRGECRYNPRWMRVNCAFSCRAC